MRFRTIYEKLRKSARISRSKRAIKKLEKRVTPPTLKTPKFVIWHEQEMDSGAQKALSLEIEPFEGALIRNALTINKSQYHREDLAAILRNWAKKEGYYV